MLVISLLLTGFIVVKLNIQSLLNGLTFSRLTNLRLAPLVNKSAKSVETHFRNNRCGTYRLEAVPDTRFRFYGI